MIVLTGILIYFLLGLISTVYAIYSLRYGQQLMEPWLFTLATLIFPYIWYLIYKEKKK